MMSKRARVTCASSAFVCMCDDKVPTFEEDDDNFKISILYTHFTIGIEINHTTSYYQVLFLEKLSSRILPSFLR